MEDIKIEKAKDQKTVSIPREQTYYQVLGRNKDSNWFAGIMFTDENQAIQSARRDYSMWEEVKIISFKLPF